MDYHAGELVTGGSDKFFKKFSLSKGAVEQIAALDIFEKNLLSVKINRYGGAGHALAGCADGKIYLFDHGGSPIMIFEQGSPVSSVDFIN